MPDKLTERLKRGLDEATSKPKRKATDEEVAIVNRFVFAANVVGPIKKLFEGQESATGTQVIHPDERDAVIHQMNVALEKLENKNVRTRIRRESRLINQFARQAARNKARGSG